MTATPNDGSEHSSLARLVSITTATLAASPERQAFARTRKIAIMKTDTPSWTTLVVATHLNRSDPINPAVVIGFGLLTATRCNRDDWSFVLNAEVADMLADEPSILTTLADHLPRPDFLIADGIEQRVFTLLDGAADRAGPIIAAHLRHRLARLRLALPVDLAVGRARRVGPLPHDEPPSVTAPVVIVVAGDAIVDVARARVELEQRVIGDWLRFLRAPHGPTLRTPCGTAAIATITWAIARGLA